MLYLWWDEFIVTGGRKWGEGKSGSDSWTQMKTSPINGTFCYYATAVTWNGPWNLHRLPCLLSEVFALVTVTVNGMHRRVSNNGIVFSLQVDLDWIWNIWYQHQKNKMYFLTAQLPESRQCFCLVAPPTVIPDLALKHFEEKMWGLGSEGGLLGISKCSFWICSEW